MNNNSPTHNVLVSSLVKDEEKKLIELENLKNICVARADEKIKSYKLAFFSAVIIYAIVNITLIFILTWPVMALFTYLCPFILCIFTYCCMVYFGKTFNISKFIKHLRGNIIKKELKLASLEKMAIESALAQIKNASC